MTSGFLDDFLPQGLSKNEEFVADLKLEKTAWVYINEKRVLLVMKSADKADAKRPAVIKDWRAVGVAATVALQAKKIDNAIFLMSQKAVGDHELYGHFINAAKLANYEYAHKKAADAPKEGEDPRTVKKSKKVTNVEFQDEKDTLS